MWYNKIHIGTSMISATSSNLRIFYLVKVKGVTCVSKVYLWIAHNCSSIQINCLFNCQFYSLLVYIQQIYS